MRLSVLDQSIAVVGRPHGQSIRDTIALAQHCEALGRGWGNRDSRVGMLLQQERAGIDKIAVPPDKLKAVLDADK